MKLILTKYDGIKCRIMVNMIMFYDSWPASTCMADGYETGRTRITLMPGNREVIVREAPEQIDKLLEGIENGLNASVPRLNEF